MPSSLLPTNSGNNDEGETVTVDTPITSRPENAEIVNNLTKMENKNSSLALGAWNLDGEILPQPSQKALHFRFIII